MFEKFCDYMYYLLTSPFKRVKKAINQWYILFRVLGSRFDNALVKVIEAREQTMLATCDPVMLQVHANDRNLTRYSGEEDENFRRRIANYTEVCRLGGTNEGVKLAVWSLGYDNVELVPAKEFAMDDERWAEFYLIIELGADETHPVNLEVLKKEVRKSKEVGAKDNYMFYYNLEIGHIISSKLTKVTFNLETYYFDYIRLDGKYFMDGSTFLNSTLKNDKITVTSNFIIEHDYFAEMGVV